jgi:putative membrane protein
MIDYERQRWAQIIFRASGSVVPRLLGRVLFASLLGVAAVELHARAQLALSPIAHTMIGAALGLLLVFRTNASYDRYWEGRRLLGSMIVRARDIARQLAAYLPGDAHRETRHHVRRWVEAFYRLAAQDLRGERAIDRVEAVIESERAAFEASPARPQLALAWASAELARLAKEGALPELRLRSFDANFNGLIEALTGCERILRTPVPFAYAQHIKTFVALFCFTAPFTMSDAMGWLTPIASGLLAFALIGIDEIGVEIEDPFGTDANDLPVDGLGDRIAIDTKAIVDASPPI